MLNFSFCLIMNNLRNFPNFDIMKRILILLAIIINSLCAFSQDINKKIQNNSTNEEILIGLCNRHGLQSGKYAEWFNQEYDYYKYLMERSNLDSIKSILDSFKITVVMGTWCSDSKEQVPRFFCILDYLKFNFDNLTIYCVDRNKKTMSNEIDNLQIEKVPTIIFFYHGKEAGRIIESPVKSLEKDLMPILRSVTLNTPWNGK
jgi:hypothetical protein